MMGLGRWLERIRDVFSVRANDNVPDIDREEMIRAAQRMLNHHVVAVAWDRHLHELEVDLAYDVDRQQRRSRLRCGKEVHIPIGKMFLAKPGTIDCPDCVAARTKH